MKKLYTVKELAQLSGISVRTLHHYDELKLLCPKTRSNAGYRLYGESELLRLQQILFYRELEVPLKEINNIVDDPSFNQKKALLTHREALLDRKNQIDDLIQTIDLTLLKLEGKEMVTDKDLYKGFTPEQIKRYETEVAKNYDSKLVAESKNNLNKMTKQKWENIKDEGDLVSKELAEAMKNGESIDSDKVQILVQRHHKWIENFYKCTKNVYVGLGDMYLNNLEFFAHYEQFGTGLTNFLSSAMKKYSESLSA